MEKLTIELDCNEETCGKCLFINLPSLMPEHCALFRQKLVSYGNFPTIDFQRLPECIAACKAQRGKGK